jgi:homocysteine S-methyltransferase
MSKYRNGLPQMNGETVITDGGMETTLIFHDGCDLPLFAAFGLMRTEEGRDRLKAYYRRYFDIARRNGVGFVLETPTWRASPDWGARLGYDAAALKAINASSVDFLEALRRKWETPGTRCVVSGCVGPRGDGYSPETLMTAEEAESYHAPQVRAFADSGADMVGVLTMTHAGEAAGIARAARAAEMPVAISFTVETDGRLPSGQALGDAVAEVDAASDRWPAYFMINCAHPSHFAGALDEGAAWTRRIGGLRANASTMSHAELDNAETLDEGDPAALGRDYRELLARMPWINVLGGCCGTDHRHIAAICGACVGDGRAAAE